LKVINFDIKAGEGIDISGDIFDNDTFERLKQYQFDCILLCNVLEHVPDYRKLCLRIQALMKERSILIVTVPYAYPCHFDPIDNGLRPDINQLASLFPGLDIVERQIIEDYAYSYYLTRNWRILVKFLLRLIAPFYKYYTWRNTIVSKIPYLFKNFKISCVVLKKRRSIV